MSIQKFILGLVLASAASAIAAKGDFMPLQAGNTWKYQWEFAVSSLGYGSAEKSVLVFTVVSSDSVQGPNPGRRAILSVRDSLYGRYETAANVGTMLPDSVRVWRDTLLATNDTILLSGSSMPSSRKGRTYLFFKNVLPDSAIWGKFTLQGQVRWAAMNCWDPYAAPNTPCGLLSPSNSLFVQGIGVVRYYNGDVVTTHGNVQITKLDLLEMNGVAVAGYTATGIRSGPAKGGPQGASAPKIKGALRNLARDVKGRMLPTEGISEGP